MGGYKEINIGNVCLCLFNKVGVDESIIKEVVCKSQTPKSTISLALGLCKLSDPRYRAQTMPNDNPNSKADIQIGIRKDVTDDWSNFTPHFVFSLAHELEHARILLLDRELHYCLSWLFKHNKAIFCEAGKKPKGKQFDFLHERQCNRKGKSIAIELYGSKNFEDSLKLKRLSLQKNDAYKENIDFLLCLQGNPYGDNVCELLKNDICSYYSEIEGVVHTIRCSYPDNNFNLSDFILPPK